MNPLRRLTVLALALAFFSAAGAAFAQTDCAVRQGNQRSLLPRFSAVLIVLTTSNDARYLYGLVSFGMVRAPITNPANASPLSLVQIGRKFDNGGIIPMNCDCYQMGTTMAFAEAPDGSARMFMNNHRTDGSGLPAHVARASGTGDPSFGQQVLIPAPAGIGFGIGAIYLPASGKFIGYIPADNGVQIIDGTNVNGDPAASAALQPIGSISWVGYVRLKAARIQVPSLAYDKFLLIGAMGTQGRIRIAEIDPSSGVPTERANVATVGEPGTPDIAVVNGRIFVFSPEVPGGLQIYEYTPSPFGGTLARVASIPGDYNPVVVRGGQFPAIFAHRSEPSPSLRSFVDIYDTKFLTQGGTPRRAYSLPHAFASEDQFLGRAFDAVVKTEGPVVTAYVYRLVGKRAGETEDSVRTDKLDISCIAADPTAPPVASVVGTNLSAAQRTGAEASKNYFGDRWQLRDASASFHPITRLDWDFTYTGTFAPEVIASPPGTWSDVNPAYYPCDQLAAGADIRTGANCHGSLAPGNYQFALRSHNLNGPSLNTFISAPINVLTPQARIAGFDGTTLRVLSGGQANASASDGNIAGATFTWTFNGEAGPSGINLNTVSVPTNATSFTLAIRYTGDYVANASGTVQQVDLVPQFDLAPNPVLNGAQLTLTNRMEKGTTTTLNSVTYSINSTPPLSGPLAAPFLAVNGLAAVTAPGTTGNYTIELTYNFSGPAGPNQTLTVTKPFPTTSFAPNPLIGIYIDAARTQPVFCQVAGCFVNANQPYYLSDEEIFPTGITPPERQWFFTGSSGTETPIGVIPAGSLTPLSYTFSTPCNSGCSVRVLVGGVSRSLNVVISNPQPPIDPPPPPPSGLRVTLSGPSTAATGTSVTFSASASGGVGTVSFGWLWGDNALSINYLAGTATNSYTYTLPGTFSVSVRATDSTGAQAVAAAAITITGNPAPSSAHTLAGATLNSSTNEYDGRVGRSITFTAGELSASKWEWDFGDGTTGSGRTVQKTYSSAGMWTVKLAVTGSGTTSGTSTASITLRIVAPRPSEDFALEGRRRNEAGAWEVEVNVPVRFKAAEANAASYQWDFGDQTTASGREVEKTFTATGARTVRLTIQGNNTQTAGTTTLSFNVSIQTCATGARNLCLNRNRFRVTVTAKNPRDGRVGTGQTLPKKDAFGFFSFPELTRDAENAEVFVKILDGTRINGFYWLFRGAMTDFELDYTIRDTVTGAVKTYHKDAGPSCGSFDTEAFPGGSGSDSVSAAAMAAISVNISGPSSAGRASPVTFTASVSGASGDVTYAWKASPFLSLEPFVNGSNTFTHTFETLGKQWVSVRVRDSSSAVAYAETEVNVTGQTGPPPPSAAFGVTGATLESPGVYKGSVETQLKFTATEEKAGSWTWDFGDATTATGREVTKTYTTGGTRTVRLTVTGNGTDTVGTATRSITLDLVACAAGPNSLCLQKGRFRVKLEAKDPRTGRTGAGEASQESDTFGYFTLASLTGDPNNPEVFMKLLDGRTFNQRFWVFGDVLSDMETTLTVTDTETGQVATYRKESGRACGGILDVQAFPRP